MILQALTDYYEKLAEAGKVERPGWGTAKVSYGLNLDDNGIITSVVLLKQENERGKKTVWVPQLLKVPEPVKRASGISANFLCDNSSYFFGIDRKGKPERAEQCFLAAKEKHLQILKNCTGNAARSVISYFENWDIRSAEEYAVFGNDKEELFSGVNLVFVYKGKYVQEDPEIQEAWEYYRDQKEEGPKALCMVSGKIDTIARIHTAIKGIPGIQPSGALLVSFNEASFQSYAKEQSYNAPVGEKAMYSYTTALNYMLQDDRHRSIIGDTTVVYWAQSGESAYQDLFADMMDPRPETQDVLNDTFKRMQKKMYLDPDDTKDRLMFAERFYVLGLAPNMARLSVRFFYQDSFGNILKNMADHYENMNLCRPAWDQNRYLGVWRMLQETVNKKSKEKNPTPHMAAAAFRAVLSGSAYPAALYTDVLRRIRVEQDDDENHIKKITPGRVAIIKAVLRRNYKKEVSVELNENNTNIAYVLGREFALLEEIQEKANPEINATIKDRYFNSACTTPAVVFPILFRLKNSHIKKIKSNDMKNHYERKLGELQNQIIVSDTQSGAYPMRLSLEEQGMFILGYYHQVQSRFQKEKKEEK